MSKTVVISALAALTFGGVMMGPSAPALAQVGVEIGPGGARVYEGRPYHRRHVERRVIVEDDDDDCRIVVRRHINRFGERVTRRTRVCD